MFGINSEIPDIKLGTLRGDEIVELSTKELFGKGLSVLVGLPGVFTPVCTKDHIPTLIASADDLKAKGVKQIYCISDDNVWALDAWAKTIPGSEKIVFLSDGNHDFLKASRLFGGERNLFLAEKYARFYALIFDRRIIRIRQETSVIKTSCTTGACILSDIADARHALKLA
jgi:peroxiredoxin